MTLHCTHATFQHLHLFRHASLRPFFIGARDILLVSQQLVELAADDGRVVVAGDFVVEFIEGDVAEVAVLGLDFGDGFGELGFGRGFCVGVFLVGIGFAGGTLGGFGFGVRGDAGVVVLGCESSGFRHVGTLQCVLRAIDGLTGAMTIMDGKKQREMAFIQGAPGKFVYSRGIV